MKKANSGFTLIELMMVVVIIGILAAIAFPNYTSHLRKVRRDDAMAALTACANLMERFYTQNYTYIGAACAGGTDYYTIAAATPTATTYTLTATPVVGSVQDGDGMLQLLSTGLQRWDENDNKLWDAGESDWKPG